MRKTMLLLAALALGGASGAFAQTADAASYPPCSRTVTDRCTQAAPAAHHATHRHAAAHAGARRGV